jgi:hypothetical protein
MVAIEQYIKNVEITLADLKKAVATEKIKNQAEKTNDEINTELSIRL